MCIRSSLISICYGPPNSARRHRSIKLNVNFSWHYSRILIERYSRWPTRNGEKWPKNEPTTPTPATNSNNRVQTFHVQYNKATDSFLCIYYCKYAASLIFRMRSSSLFVPSSRNARAQATGKRHCGSLLYKYFVLEGCHTLSLSHCQFRMPSQ